MRTATLAGLGIVSRLTLGGGGIGQGWGETSRDEASATLTSAIDQGIDLIDTAPMYLNCEAIIGETFQGALPNHVKTTTKCQLGSPGPGRAAEILEASLAASLATMRLSRIDAFFLHSSLAADDYAYARGDERRDRFSTRWSTYVEEVVPTFERLKAQGRIGAWGITGIGVPVSILAALDHHIRPDVVQVICNLMDSPGGIRQYAEPPQPRTILAKAQSRGVGIMGIRAVQAGALTRALDRSTSPNHPETKDYERAAPFRALCAAWGEDPAIIAHRYALGMDGVATVVLGVKNREELNQALAAEQAGPLEASQVEHIDQLGLRS